MPSAAPQSAADVAAMRNARVVASIAGLGAAAGCCALVSRGRLTGTLTLVDLWENLHSPLKFVLAVWVGAYYDLLFIGALTLAFAGLAHAALRRARLQRTIGWVYLVLAAAVVLLGFVNVTVVHYLGTPLTYQWFTYSDSLTSFDAQNSVLGIAAGLSARAIAAAVAVTLAVIVAALLFQRLFLAAVRRYAARTILLGVAVAASIHLGFGYWYLEKLHYNHSLVANPVFAFTGSLIGEGSPALLTMPGGFSSADFDVAATRPLTYLARTDESPIKNVLLFVFESVPATYVEPFGSPYPVTPTLAKYRSQSALFANIYAHSPNTNVSLVSLLTGTYPWLSPRFVTQEYPSIRLHSLSAELKDRGYRTAVFSSADLRFLDADQFLAHHGIDLQVDRRSIPCEIPAAIAAGAAMRRMLGERSFEMVNDKCTADALDKWIAAAPQEPFFALLWTDMTHHPYAAGAEEVDYGVDNPSLNRYLNALREGDRALGRIMRTLETAGLADSTLVVVLGDHGEAFGTHGQVIHASNIYEENVHIPLLFINRRLFHGEASGVVGGMSDIAPTILDLLGMAEPGDWQGRSLFSPGRSPRTYFFAPWADLIYGYREGDRKMIFDATTNEYAIYDLARDPGETRNLIDESPGAREEITGRLAAWVQYQHRLMRHLTSPAASGNDDARGALPDKSSSFGVGRDAVFR